MTTDTAPPLADAPKPVASVRHPVIRGIADPAALGLASDVITRAAGYTGFVVGILGLYGCFASVVNATWHRTVIPLGSRE